MHLPSSCRSLTLSLQAARSSLKFICSYLLLCFGDMLPRKPGIAKRRTLSMSSAAGYSSASGLPLCLHSATQNWKQTHCGSWVRNKRCVTSLRQTPVRIGTVNVAPRSPTSKKKEPLEPHPVPVAAFSRCPIMSCRLAMFRASICGFEATVQLYRLLASPALSKTFQSATPPVCKASSK